MSEKDLVFWNVGTTATVLHDHLQFLHVRVDDPKLVHPIYLTLSIPQMMLIPEGLVGETSPHFSLHGESLASWGRFNVIAQDDERTGHNIHDQGSTAFSGMILDCGLEDG